MQPTAYKVPVKANPVFTFFLAVWATGALAMAITLVLSMIDSSRYEVGLFIVAAIVLLLSFLAFNLVVWKYKGQEILLVSTDGILLRRSNNYFKREQFISYHEFESISYDDDSETPRWIKIYNLGGGKIKVNYLGTARRFGQSLSPSEAKELSTQINQSILDNRAAEYNTLF